MESGESYVYFALKGDNFNPQIVTDRIGIKPTKTWRKGDKGESKYHPPFKKYTCWKLSTEKGKEYFEIDKLVDEIVNELFDKIEIINDLKKELQLYSVLEIVMDIDINPDISTPALGHDLRTLEFLYKTETITDVDIYRFDSASNETTR